MKLYFEIIEELTEEEALIKQPQIVRLEVNSKEEANEKLLIYEPLFVKRNYVKRLHKCFHEEGQSCVIEDLKTIIKKKI